MSKHLCLQLFCLQKFLISVLNFSSLSPSSCVLNLCLLAKAIPLSSCDRSQRFTSHLVNLADPSRASKTSAEGLALCRSKEPSSFRGLVFESYLTCVPTQDATWRLLPSCHFSWPVLSLWSSADRFPKELACRSNHLLPSSILGAYAGKATSSNTHSIAKLLSSNYWTCVVWKRERLPIASLF